MEQSVLATRVATYAQTIVPGEKLQGRYLIIKKLGAGGMGAVYEALDERLQVTVAIKETFAIDRRLRRQFEQEARLLAQLAHPALPRVSDYFTEDERAFLVMQFISGDDLAQVIAERPGPFPRAQVIAWADQLLDALIYLHTRERQIIHRDIKPHNLKVTANGQIALLDFGLAKAHAGDQTTTVSSHSIFGYTRRYSPLEQIQDQGTSPQSDIYALGATLYHLLTGLKPPDALARAAALANSQADPLAQTCDIHPIIGRELSAVVHRALALNSSDRFQTASEFRDALRAVGRSESTRHPVDSQSIGGARPSFDPFDSYSILKPDEMAWLPRRRAWTAPAAVCVCGVVALVIFAASSFVSSAPDTGRPLTDYVKASAARTPGLNPNARDLKADRSRTLSSASAAAAPAGESFHRTERPKRNNKTTPGPVNPPTPSLGPALRLPAQ